MCPGASRTASNRPKRAVLASGFLPILQHINPYKLLRFFFAFIAFNFQKEARRFPELRTISDNPLDSLKILFSEIVMA
jgi:hypothetical protein